MDVDTLRVLVALGLGLLLILLRFDAERFGAAEYDELDGDGRPPSRLRRIAWYAIGLALVAGAVRVHPAPDLDLRLSFGNRIPALAGGLLFALVGTGSAILFAIYRYGRLRLPPTSAYAGAVVNAVVTALVDEAAFRGILLGFLLEAGVNPVLAILGQAILYALATGLARPGGDRWMLLVVLAIGIVGGWLTAVTGGIGAAFLGHAITRLALFVATGHPGHPAPRGRETEEMEERRRPPEGWRMVGLREPRERSSR